MSLNVLLVDDDETVNYLHKIIVEESSLSNELYSAFNGEQALTYLQKRQPGNTEHFLILLDINMPIMNGWEFLDSIQQETFSDRVSVVMVTSSTDNADRKKAEQYKQVIEYVEKPITTSDCEKLKDFNSLSPFFVS